MVNMTLRTPCEIIVWKILPAIRSELAKELVEKKGFSQKETAEKLGLTEAAVSRYISGKRADTKIIGNGLKKEIIHSTNQIIAGNEKTVISEICRICDYLKERGVLDKVIEC